VLIQLFIKLFLNLFLQTLLKIIIEFDARLHSTPEKLLHHFVYGPALLPIYPAKRAANQMYPQFDMLAQADRAHFLLIDQIGRLFAVMYNFFQIAHG